MTPEREREIRERTADLLAGATTPVRPVGVEQLGRDLSELLAYVDQLRAEVERLTRTYELNRYHTLRPGALALREPGACVCGHQLRDHHGLMGVCSVVTCPCDHGRASVPECGAHNQAVTCNRPLGHTGEHHWHLRRPHTP